MSGKNRDQRRKDKLAERAKKDRERQRDAILPYDGTTYQAPAWVPWVAPTELAVYDAIVASGRRLTNDQVKAAFEGLVRHLREGNPGPLPEGAPDVAVLGPGTEVEFLMWNIRRRWRLAFARNGPVAAADLIGILRTLLNSIVAHEWNTGPDLGYVAFIYKFLRAEG